MKRTILLSTTAIALFLLTAAHAVAGTFTSKGNGGGAWSGGTATWNITGDTDGVIDQDDDVIILAGDNITWGTATNFCKSLTLQGKLTGSNAGAVTYITAGDYTITSTGNEAGVGQIAFKSVNKNITATGTLAAGIKWIFYSNMTILSPSVITKTNMAFSNLFNASVIVHNQGTVTVGAVTTTAGTSWINDANSTLTLTAAGFMSGRVFTTNATGSTVNIKYPTGAIPTASAGYYNLALTNTAAGAKTLPAATTVLNNLTINALNTLNVNGFDLSIGGNFLDNGIFTQGTNTVFLNGATTQTVGGTATITFFNLTKNTASTVTLTNNVIVTSNLNISNGILDGATFGPTGTAALTMTGGELRVAKLGTEPELSGAYNLTGGKVTFSGAGVQTIKALTYNNIDVTGTGTKILAGVLNLNGSLNITSGLDVTAGSYAINLKGNWTNTGTFVPQNGTVTFKGTTAQTISGTSTNFASLALSNTAGASITGGTYTLSSVLTLSNGTFNTGGNAFTMLSTASQTARIAPITGTGAAAGNFIVQRFITTRDTTWSDLSSPVQNSTFGDWANELPAIYYGYSPPSAYPTQYTYDETADDFSPVTSASTVLTPGKGFEVFMSGDFSYSNLPNTTINTIGVPNQGNQDLSGLISFNSSGTNLVGNPFASSISWNSVLASSSGILSTYDVYDYTAGNYATYGTGTEIGSAQGFWVYTTTSAAHLRINESAKTTSSNSSLREAVIEPYFTLKLSSNDAGNHYSHTLKVAATDVASDGWDDTDHPYRQSPNKLAPAIYTTIDTKKSVINSFSLLNDSYSMPLQTRAGISGSYKIEAAGFENMSDYTCIQLEDTQLHKTIDLIAAKSYSFRMNTTDKPGRFILHFSKSANCAAAANAVAKSDMSTVFDENNISILPTMEGNAITFNLSDATPAMISVTNLLGQQLVEATQVTAQNQTVNITLPEGFSGMYLIRVEAPGSVITKKFVRK